jgi:hypothetical protein
MKTAEEFLKENQGHCYNTVFGTISVIKLMEDYAQSKQEDITGIIDKVANQNPYKVKGKPETYNDYNQGWEDACGVIESEINKLK